MKQPLGVTIIISVNINPSQPAHIANNFIRWQLADPRLGSSTGHDTKNTGTNSCITAC